MRKILILLFIAAFWGSGLQASDATTLSHYSLLAPAPAASAFPNPVCVGSKLNLYASGGTAYYWQGPNGFTSNNQNPVINVTTMQHIGTYSVTISLPTSGTIVKSVEVMVEPISPDAVADETLCEGATSPQIDFSGGNFYTQYEWTNSNTSIGLAAGGTDFVPTFVATNPTNSTITGNISVNLLKPSTPVLPKVINFADRISTYTNVSLDGGSNYKEVAPGQNVNLTYDYNTYFAGGYCTGCITQLYIGVGTTNTTLECRYYNNGNFNTSGSANLNFTAPTTPGYYYVVQTGTLDYVCQPQNFPNTGGTAIALFKVAEPNIQPNNSLYVDIADRHCSVYNIQLDNGPNVKKVPPGASVNLKYDYYYQWFQGICQNFCIMQVYAGLGGSNTTINCTNIQTKPDASGSVNADFTAPNAPGIYYIVMQGSTGFSCTPQSFSNSPDLSIAMIIVDPPACPSSPISFNINVNPTPDATASASPNPACVGQTLNLSSSGGTSYSWSGPIGFTSSLQNPVINNVQQLQAGTYTVTVTGTEGCSSTASVDVIVNPTPDAFALAIPNPLCQGETLSLYGLSNNGVSYAWSGPNSFSSNQQNPVITDIQPAGSGIYTLTVTNSNGCTNTATANVTVNPLPVVVIGATPNPICVGQTLSLSASGGVAYTWSGPASFSSNQQNPSISNIQLTQAGVYIVTVTSTQGCTSTSSINVVVNPLPVPTADASPNPICEGKTLSLSSSGGTSYSWSGPSGYSSNQQNPTIANIQLSQGGVYFVTVTSQDGCTAATSVTVVVNPTPVATADASPNPICEGKKLFLTATGGVSYSWSGPNGFTSNQQDPKVKDIQLNEAGVYTVTVTNEYGCTSEASVTVIVNDSPEATIDAAPNPICVGKTLSLTAGGGDTYKWSGPNGFNSNIQNPTVANIQLNQAGLYIVKVKNFNGCKDSASVEVIVNELPIAAAYAVPNPICVGKTLSLTSTGGTSYAWSGPAGYTSSLQNPSISNIQLSQAGIYTVTVTNDNGCTDIASVNVVVNPLPVPTASASPNPICVGKTLSLTSSGGTSYAWSGPGGFSSYTQNPSIANIQLSQDGIYTVTVTNTYGCSSSASVDVVVNPLPNATATATPNQVCEGELATFSANGGVGYSWSGPGGFTSNSKQFGRHMALNMAGTYYVTVTNSNGCSSTASVSISVNAGPNATASVSPNPACSGQTVQFSASGGTSYKWTGPFGFASTQQNPMINNVQQYHSGNYTVVVSNNTGCKKTIVVTLTVNQTPAGKISFDAKSTCTGSTLLLYASGGNSYQWSGPAGFSSTLQNPTRPNANSTYSGLYTVVITNSSGCSVTLSVNVTIRPLPTISAWTTTPEVCEGSTAFLYATGGTSYSWTGPYGYASTFQNPIITNIPTYMTGTYTVTGSNQYGCTAKANVFITVQSVNAIVNATPNPVPYGGTLYLTASGGTSYQWTGPNGFNTTQQNPIIYKFTNVKEGLYSCIVSSSAGCQDTKIILVKLKVNGLVGQDNTTEKIEGNFVQVFPNPASSSIKLSDGSMGVSEYQILNDQGQIVMSGKSSAGEQIQISTLAPGAYYIHWTYQNDNDKKVSNISRFIKTN